MADYSKNIIERLTNRGPNVGYCAICRVHGPLTKDHVPPKGCGNINDSVISHVYGSSPEKPGKPVLSQGGSHFRTICGQCNNMLLGTEYDPALRDAVRTIEAYFRRATVSRLALPRTQLFDYQPNRFLRSVLGHLLAANAVPDVTVKDRAIPLDDALRAYVRDSSASLPDEVCVYYWFYPYRRRVVMKHSAMGFLGGNGTAIYGHVFKFFPFGFWIVWNEEGDHSNPFNLRRLADSSPVISASSRLVLDLSPLKPLNFPEAPTDNGMWLVTDYLVSQAEDRPMSGRMT
ncbi:hypothetical protein HDG34_002810 [Paraburkholderia sp. HC6.4b]|uniref:hypothetical protein n=1 Tax=unclassified Paraburkholderia TaxID=2615204 RepID=UPI001621C410|nr:MULTISPECIES: hypothetical protein [unclassified Paraburkholderia]MBB5408873.1 hypothetical protein [Paraburkholderia sp. HC6.4b]MBB5450601.1 hypothetical protein [Paraburkholderia sp. Kb1A]